MKNNITSLYNEARICKTALDFCVDNIFFEEIIKLKKEKLKSLVESFYELPDLKTFESIKKILLNSVIDIKTNYSEEDIYKYMSEKLKNFFVPNSKLMNYSKKISKNVVDAMIKICEDYIKVKQAMQNYEDKRITHKKNYKLTRDYSIKQIVSKKINNENIDAQRIIEIIKDSSNKVLTDYEQGVYKKVIDNSIQINRIIKAFKEEDYADFGLEFAIATNCIYENTILCLEEKELIDKMFKLTNGLSSLHIGKELEQYQILCDYFEKFNEYLIYAYYNEEDRIYIENLHMDLSDDFHLPMTKDDLIDKINEKISKKVLYESKYIINVDESVKRLADLTKYMSVEYIVNLYMSISKSYSKLQETYVKLLEKRMNNIPDFLSEQKIYTLRNNRYYSICRDILNEGAGLYVDVKNSVSRTYAQSRFESFELLTGKINLYKTLPLKYKILHLTDYLRLKELLNIECLSEEEKAHVKKMFKNIKKK